MNKKDRGKKDSLRKQSHHKTNFLVIFSNNAGTVKRAVVNALDEKSAIRLALCRLCRLYPEEVITRARIAGVFSAGVHRVEKRIGYR